MWDPELIWDGRRGGLAILNAVLCHLVKQRFRQEARRLAHAKFDRCPTTPFQQLEQALIFFRGVVRVELLSKGGNHDKAEIRHRPRGDSRPRLSGGGTLRLFVVPEKLSSFARPDSRGR